MPDTTSYEYPENSSTDLYDSDYKGEPTHQTIDKQLPQYQTSPAPKSHNPVGTTSIPRVILWCTPRSISTAFTRAIMNNRDVKVLLEPYCKAFRYGPDRMDSRQDGIITEQDYSYNDVKRLCQQEEKDHAAIFVKDMPKHFGHHLEKIQYMPDGFTHTFLIRHPRKSVRSWYKISESQSWNFNPNQVGNKELHEMYEFVKKHIDRDPLIIDADDLLADPEPYLQEYCRRTGIPYTQTMVNWQQTDLDLDMFYQLKDWIPYFKRVLTTDSFRPDSVSKNDSNPLPPEVEDCIMNCLPYYNDMYANRWTIYANKPDII